MLLLCYYFCCCPCVENILDRVNLLAAELIVFLFFLYVSFVDDSNSLFICCCFLCCSNRLVYVRVWIIFILDTVFELQFVYFFYPFVACMVSHRCVLLYSFVLFQTNVYVSFSLFVFYLFVCCFVVSSKINFKCLALISTKLGFDACAGGPGEHTPAQSYLKYHK